MEITRLSSKGQLIIPKKVRKHHNWGAGQEFELIEESEELILKPRRTHVFPVRSLDEVAGCLPYDGPTKSLEEIEDAIAEGMREQWGRRHGRR